MFKSTENLISSKIWYRLKGYITPYLIIIFELPLGAYHVYTAIGVPLYLLLFPGGVKLYTGINTTRIRKKAVSEDFLIYKIS